MSTAELKNDLHRLIVETDDINILQKIQAIFNSFIKGEENNDWWDTISDQEKSSIKKGIEQLESGERFTQQEVRF
ncbi:MAG: hypothetical protein R2788_04475 [Saprospiraceae bacterium]